jgi:hypothetical protein
MSDINLDFTVSNNSIDFTVEPNDITITPTDIQLIFSSSSVLVPGGANTQILYNNSGSSAGSPAITYNNISNVVTISNANITSAIGANLGNVSNVKITGGINGYVLQTDGSGNLNWTAQTGGGGNGTPGGANTQIQFNDGGLFGGNNYFTFNKATGDMVIPNNLSLGSGFPLFGGNISGMQANFTGNIISGSYVQGDIRANGLLMLGTSVALFPTVNSLKIGGGLANYILKTDGAGNLSWSSDASSANSANYANYAGNVTISNQPNITNVGTLTNLAVAGNVTLVGVANLTYGTENVGIITSGSGTINFDVITNAIKYNTANATGNITLNMRGNSTISLNSFLPNSASLTTTYLMKTGATAYGITAMQIDSVSQTISWVNNILPIQYPNTTSSYTFTIIKTATTPTYKILGSATRYGA